MYSAHDSETPERFGPFAPVIILVVGALIAYVILADSRVVEAVDITTTTIISICGDGVVSSSEACDNGLGNNTGLYASSTSARTCGTDCTSFGPYCGDGILQVRFIEQCDDGNNTSGDLCTAACITETPTPPGSIGSPTVGSIPSIPGATPGGVLSQTETKVVLRGKAYPQSNVKILVDGKEVGSARADINADFLFTTTEVTPGTATFSFLAKDKNGVNSLTSSVVFEVLQSAVTTVANIFLPPTISASSDHVEPGALLTLSGQSVPGTTVVSEIQAPSKIIFNASADTTGAWALQVDTSSLSQGFHAAKAYFQLTDLIKSGFGRSVNFYVGVGPPPGEASADLNGDEKVNLVDFSIFLTDWGTSNIRNDFNLDGIVNLADFSILLFNWTG